MSIQREATSEAIFWAKVALLSETVDELECCAQTREEEPGKRFCSWCGGPIDNASDGRGPDATGSGEG
jgi:hypothetical protein